MEEQDPQTKLQGVDFRLQVPTPVEYKGLRLDCAFKADIVRTSN